MKTKKIISAGPLVVEAIYPRASRWDSPKARGAKRKLSSEAQQKANAKYSYQKLELMLAANFVPGDLILTLTYDEAHLPRTREAAAARLKKFRADLAALRKRSGRELLMIWNTENVFNLGRWHHHCVVNACGEDFEAIRRLWGSGENVEIRKLQIDKDHSYESLARYMCKEARERPGLRSWSYTRSCRKPEIETFPVPDDTDVKPPEDATIVAEAVVRTEFGEFHFVKYLAADPQELRRHRPRARHRRRS